MGFWWRICWDIESGCKVTVYKWEFSGLKIPYDTVLAADFADFEYAASAKSCCWAQVCEQ